MMNLSDLSLAQLRKLSSQVAQQLVMQADKEPEIPVEQVPTSLSGKSRRKRAAGTKYQDPANPDNTWGGRGPRPSWLKKAIAAGKSLNDFRVGC